MLFYDVLWSQLICYEVRIFVFLFKVTPAAHESSWARGWIRAVAPVCNHSCSNVRSEMRLWPMLHSQPTEQGQGSKQHPHRDHVRFLTCWATTGTPEILLKKGVLRKFPLWLSGLQTQVVSPKMQFDSWPHSVGSGSCVAMICGVHWRNGLDPMLLWLWCRPTGGDLIQPLPWESPYATGEGLKKKKRKKEKKMGVLR